MKKIGILTFHRAVNYGAVFQTYALQRSFEKKGVVCEVIDYHNHVIEDYYYSIWKKNASMKRKVKALLEYPLQNMRNQGFIKFRECFLKLSEKKYNRLDVKESNTVYQSFVTGSDQVWNLQCTGKDMSYYLDFVKDRRKYSYAASFGKADKTDQAYREAAKQIVDFSRVSVREQNGKDIIQSVLQKECRVDVDPVFLLEKEEWEKLADTSMVPDKKYLLLYTVDLNERVYNAAKKMSQQFELPLYVITLRNKYIPSTQNCRLIKKCSPEAFLGYILKADKIVTNSFHGTAFSILFNKEFFLVRNANKNTALDNTRLDTLIGNFDLGNRIVEGEIRDDRIDYTKTNQTIESMRGKALEYLNQICQGTEA